MALPALSWADACRLAGGKPSATVVLAPSSASAQVKLAQQQAWVLVSPDVLAQAKLVAGQHILVTLSTLDAQQSGRGQQTPGSTLAGASSFAPTSIPDPSTGGVQNLWAACSRAARLSHPCTPPPAWAAPTTSRTSPTDPSSTLQGQLGHYAASARVWPAAKLPKGVGMCSESLQQALGSPGAGVLASLFPLTPAALQPVSLGSLFANESSTSPGSVSAGAISSSSNSSNSSSSGAISVTSAGVLNPPPVASHLVLQVVGHTRVAAPIKLPAAGAVQEQGAAPSTPGGAIGSSARPVSASQSPSGRSSSGSSRTPPPATPKTPQPGTPAATTATPASRTGVDTGVAGSLSSWVLQLLRGPGGPSGTGNQQQQQQQSPAAAGGSTGSPAQVPAGITAEQRRMLGQVALQHLGGRVLLPGNPVPLPLLGHTVLCSVQLCLSDSSQGQGQRQEGPEPVCLGAGRVEAGSTQVTLLMPGEVLAYTPPPTSSESQVDAASYLARYGVSGLTSGAGNQGGTQQQKKLQSVADLVAAAREAAEQALEGSSGQEAAANAAERALRAGLAAGGLEFSRLGGISQHVASLRELVSLPLRAPHLFSSFSLKPPRGVLLHGPPGSGKTVLARAAATDAGAVLFVLNGPDVMSEFIGESEAGLRGVWAAAQALAPSVVFIDEIDALAPARGGAGSSLSSQGVGATLAASAAGGGGGAADMATRVVTALLTLMDGGATGPAQGAPGVVVIGATNRPDALDPALRRPGRLERELEVGAPSGPARAEILEARLRAVRHSLSKADIEAIAQGLHGFVSADLAALVNEAAMAALRRAVASHQSAHQPGTGTAITPGHTPESTQDHTSGSQQQAQQQSDQAEVCVTLEDVRSVAGRMRPSALRELSVEIPSVRWSDIGGMEEVKARLQEVVEWPFKHPEALARLGATPPRGVLLYGPPGCSKTMLARAVASEARLNFLSIKGGELFSKYVGESEKAVAALFARARASAPSIIFFDEIDALAATRSESGGAGVGERVMAQLLSEMDGLQQRLGVVVLAATNRPDCIDPALLRPGRFDRLVYVQLPDASAREKILRVQLTRTPLAPDVDLALLAAQTEGFSGADLSGLVREAGLAALEEDMGAEQVCLRHFMAALATTRPSPKPSQQTYEMYLRSQGL